MARAQKTGGSLTIVSPNGGENWAAGSSHTIYWSYLNVTGNVDLALYKGGFAVQTIKTGLPATAGSYAWTLPFTLVVGGGYTVRIISKDTPSVFDFSDAAFNVIDGLQLTSPSGGENWAPGRTHTIQWNYDPGLSGNVDLTLYKGGVAYQTIKAGASIGSAGSGSYSWTLPMTLPLASDYTVRVISKTAPAASSFSAAPFAIVAGLIMVSPNGGENWPAGSPRTIYWHFADVTGTIDLALYKGGVPIRTIAQGWPVTVRPYPWTLPFDLPVASGYSIRVISKTTPSILDFSDGPFNVTAGLQMISPQGGEIWAAGRTHSIQWNYDSGLSGNVDLTLYKGGVAYQNIKTGAPIGSAGAGSYSWTLPTTLPIASDYTVRVISETTPAASSFSPAPFAVAKGLTMVSPNGGQSWAAGSIHTIYWHFADVTGNVDLTLYKGGVANQTIKSGIPAAVGSYAWTVPFALPVESDYTVRVISEATPSISDFSDGPFSVIAGMQLNSPHGGETWPAGSTQAIQWNYDSGLTGNVDLTLYKGGVAYKTIKAGAPIGSSGSGSYSWPLPATLPAASDYTVRVISTANPAASSFSHAPFAITLPQVVSVGATVADPMSQLTVNGSQFDVTATTRVRFALSTGTTIDVPAASVTSTQVRAAIPPVIDLRTGTSSAGTATVSVIQSYGPIDVPSNYIQALQINDLPGSAGSLRASLQGAVVLPPPSPTGEMVETWSGTGKYLESATFSDTAGWLPPMVTVTGVNAAPDFTVQLQVDRSLLRSGTFHGTLSYSTITVDRRFPTTQTLRSDGSILTKKGWSDRESEVWPARSISLSGSSDGVHLTSVMPPVFDTTSYTMVGIISDDRLTVTYTGWSSQPGQKPVKHQLRLTLTKQ